MRHGPEKISLTHVAVVAALCVLAASCAPRPATSAAGTAAGTGFRTVVSDRFSRPPGPLRRAGTGQAWHSIHAVWSVINHRAAARLTGGSVYAYSVLDTNVWDHYTVQADVRLSPTPLRAAPGILANYVDRKNYLFAKVEVTVAHPQSFLALGDQRRGTVHSTLCRRSHLGMVNGGTYHLAMKRSGKLVTATVSTTGGARLGSCSIRLTARQRSAFGRGRGFGLRVKIVSDEDDGRSRWDNFLVRTHP
jgi:hypothetical protein